MRRVETLMTSRSPTNLLSSDEGIGFIGLLFIILISSLGTVMVVMVMTSSRSTEQSVNTQKKVDALLVGIRRYLANHDGTTYPPTLDSLVTTDGSTCAPEQSPADPMYLTLQNWCGPYVDIQFAEASTDYKTDGWGTTFTYNSGTGAVTSCGPDRTCGNADDITYAP